MKNTLTWATVIEMKVNDYWYYYSQQSVCQGEKTMSDEEYLEACRRVCEPGTELRISTRQGNE